MDNLIFSLNATIPVFLMMVLGYFFNKIGWIDDEFASKMNKFVFRVPLPVLLFGDLATVDFSEVWDMRFVLFCFVVTVCSITIAAAVSCLCQIARSKENLFRYLTEAVRHFLESHLSRISMAQQVWHR